MHDYVTATNVYVMPSVHTNYGIFNIKYSGPKVWSSVDESLKSLGKFLKTLKRKLKEQIVVGY
jgi:hypothetical protein